MESEANKKEEASRVRFGWELQFVVVSREKYKQTFSSLWKRE